MMDRPASRWGSANNNFSSGDLSMPDQGRLNRGLLSDFLKPRKSRDFNRATRTLDTQSAGEGQASENAATANPETAALSDDHAGVQSVQNGADPTRGDKLSAAPMAKAGSGQSASASLFMQGSAGAAGAAPADLKDTQVPADIRAAAAPQRAAGPPQAATPAGQRSLGSAPLKIAKGPPGPISLPSSSNQASGQTTFTGAAAASPVSGAPLTGTKGSAEHSPGGSEGGGGGGGGGPVGQPAVEYCGNSQASESALSGQRSAIKEEARLLEVNVGKPGLAVIQEMSRDAGGALNNAAARLQDLSNALESDSAFFAREMPAVSQELAELNQSVNGNITSARQSSDNLIRAANSFASLRLKSPIPDNPGDSTLSHSWAVSGFMGYNGVYTGMGTIQSQHRIRSDGYIKKLEEMALNPQKSVFAGDGIARLGRERVLIAQARATLKDATWDYLSPGGRTSAAGFPEIIAARRARVKAIRDDLLSMNMPNAESTPIRNKLTTAITNLEQAERYWTNAKIFSEDLRAVEASNGSDRSIAGEWEMNGSASDIQRAQDKKKACTPPPPPAPPPSGK